MILVVYSGYNNFMDSWFFAAPILIIVVGVIVFIVSFFGCCGAVKENHCMIITVIIIYYLCNNFFHIRTFFNYLIIINLNFQAKLNSFQFKRIVIFNNKKIK